MFTANQIVCHLIGDYIFQSDWMATRKISSSLVAFIHALTYSIPFLFLTQNVYSLSFIVGTHFLVDRFRVARYLIFVKNFLSPRSDWLTWQECSKTGFSSNKPDFMSIWLLIIVDNILHILCNAVALTF